MEPRDSLQFDRYVRGYLDALDMIDNFSDMPIEPLVAAAREHIALRYPQAVRRVNAERSNH